MASKAQWMWPFIARSDSMVKATGASSALRSRAGAFWRSFARGAHTRCLRQVALPLCWIVQKPQVTVAVPPFSTHSRLSGLCRAGKGPLLCLAHPSEASKAKGSRGPAVQHGGLLGCHGGRSDRWRLARKASCDCRADACLSMVSPEASLRACAHCSKPVSRCFCGLESVSLRV